MTENLSSRALLNAGILVLPAFLLQDNLAVRVLQVFLFAVLALLAGKRIRFGYFAIIVVSITAFHLLVPVGRVLFEVGPLAVTQGALSAGLYKGLAVAGMVFLSLATVRPDVRLPGTTGALAAKVFWSFEHIMESRGELSWKHPVGTADRLLLNLHRKLRETSATDAVPTVERRTTTRTTGSGFGALSVVLAANWLVLAI